MVHHLFIFRPIRWLFGMLLIAGAVVFFLRAMEHAGFERASRGSPEHASSRHSWARTQEDSAGETTSTAFKLPAPDAVPPDVKAEPKPRSPTRDADSKPPDWVGQSPHSVSRDWIEANGFRTSSGSTSQSPHSEFRDGIEAYVATATSGPWKTIEECDEALDGDIDRAVAKFAEKEFPQASEANVKLDRDLVENHLVQDRYRKTVDSATVGPMQQEYALLVFDGQIRAAIEKQWRAIVVTQRLQVAAVGTGAVLLMLGGVYSLLRWKPRK